LIHERDYAANELLDHYSDRDIDDEGEFEELSGVARRAAEAKMDRRDRLERSGRTGGRAAVRSRAPRFLESDDMEDEDALDGGLGVARMKRRTRRQYDERRDLDDMDGLDDVSTLHTEWSLLLMTGLTGNSPRTTERYQGKVNCRVDSQRSCSPFNRQTFPPISDDLCG